MAEKIVQEIEVVAKVEGAIRKIDALEKDFNKTMKSVQKEAIAASKEQQRTIRKLQAEVQSSMRSIQSETKKVTAANVKLKDTLGEVASGFKSAFLAVGIIAAIKQMASLSGDFHRTTIALQKSLADLGKEDQMEGLQDFAAEMENLSGVSDETIRQMMLVGVTSGITGENLKSLVRGTLGLASATGRDANTMMTNLIKTLAGFKEESVKTLPEIVNLTREQLKAGEAITAVDKKYSKFIDTLNGPKGSLAKGVSVLEVQIANSFEQIGKALDNVGFGEMLEDLGRRIFIFSLETSHSFLGLELRMEQFTEKTQIAGNTIRKFFGGDPNTKKQEDASANIARIRKEMAKLNEQIMIYEARASGVINDEQMAELLGLGKGKLETTPFPGFGIDDDAKSQFEKDLELIFSDALHPGLDEELAERDKLKKRGQQLRKDEVMSEVDRFKSQLKILQDEQALRKEDARLLKEDLDEKEAIYENFYGNLRGLTADFAAASIGALFDQVDGEKKAFKEMLKNFLTSTGQRLIARGISDTLQGAAMAATGDVPQGTALMGIGAAEIAAGAAMRGGALLIKTPPTTGASSAGVGGSMGGSQFDTGPRNTGPRETVINILGAMTTEESAILIERGMRQAEARGFA